MYPKKDRNTELKTIPNGPYLDHLYRYQYLLSLAFLLLIYHNIFLTYGFSDDYAILWFSLKHDPPIINMLIRGGRLLAAFLLDHSFRTAHTVENLKYIRFIGLLGTWVGSIIFFRYLRKLNWPRFNALIISLIITVTPSFALYISWTCTFLVPWAFVLSFSSCIIFLNSYQSTRTHRYLSYMISFLMLLCSFFIYQPSATGFILPLSLYVLKRPKSTSLKQLLTALALFVFSLLVYMALFKFSLYAFGLQKLERAGISTHLGKDFISFFYTDLKQIVRLSFIFPGKIMKIILTILGYSILLLFYFRLLKHTLDGKMYYWCFLFLILSLPFTNIPRIASAEKWICYRSLGMTGLFMVIVFFYMMDKIKLKPLKLTIISVFALSMTFSCYKNINQKFINIQATEYKLVSDKIKQALSSNNKELILVRPNWFSHTKNCFADEYGIPSNYPSWVSLPFINLVIEEKTGEIKMVKNQLNKTSSNQIKVQIYNPEDKFKNQKQYPVINVKQILESQKKSD